MPDASGPGETERGSRVAAAARARSGRSTGPRIPGATYRLQLTPELGFPEARELVPYLSSLGISDLYLSPIFAARPGSEHGYDVVDPRRLNPGLGTRGELEELVEALEEEGMGLLLDIVPNHMAADIRNPWWRDVLEHGPASPFAGHFDIEWHAPSLPDGRLLLPVLGEPYGEALANGRFRLELNERGLELAYHDRRFPIEPGSWHHLLGREASVPREAGGLFEEAAGLPPFTATDPEAVRTRLRTVERLKQRLRELHAESAEVREWLEERLAALSEPRSAGETERTARLDRLLSDQAYWPVHWGLASEEINYRRFFAISDLPAVRVEKPAVFDEVHELALELVREGAVTGLRVDHIDGLRDPGGYLRRLAARLREAEDEAGRAEDDAPESVSDGLPGRAEAGTPPWAAAARPPLYTVVEKILAPGEELPGDWPVHGTSGYDFLGLAQGVLVDPDGLEGLGRVHTRLGEREDDFRRVSYRAKKEVLHELFGGEMRALTRSLVRLARRDSRARDISRETLGRALLRVTAGLPVYRTYISGGEVRDRDRTLIVEALETAARRSPDGSSERTTSGPGTPPGRAPFAAETDAEPISADPGREVADPALRFLRRVLTLEEPLPEQREAWLAFVADWQQLTGPVAAKGVEDTAFYRHDRLLALNEVGGEPDHIASVEDFHRTCGERLTRHPHALNAVSTHDTKRSEDARARLLVLSECPLAWERAVERWRALNAPRKEEVGTGLAPDAGEELHFYQTLLAAWPLGPERSGGFAGRMKRYAVKALREARVHSSWEGPNEAYEAAVGGFLERILAPPETPFLDDLGAFHGTIAFHGALNSLAQTLLALAAPGVPDRYRGTELWDFSLVDPDNRRPVDFDSRRAALRYLRRARRENPEGLASELTLDWRDGKIKLHLIAGALDLRRERPELFARGDYLPIAVRGERAGHVLAFARRREDAWALAAVPRRTLRLRAAAAGEAGEDVGGGDDPAGAGAGDADERAERPDGSGAEGETPEIPETGDRAGGAGEIPGDPPSRLLLPPELWGDTRLSLPEDAPGAWTDVHTGRSLRAEAPGDAEAAGRATLPVRDLFAHLPFALLRSG